MEDISTLDNVKCNRTDLLIEHRNPNSKMTQIQKHHLLIT